MALPVTIYVIVRRNVYANFRQIISNKLNKWNNKFIEVVN